MATLGRSFSDFCKRHRAELIHVMKTRRVQTNEVARAAVLMLGLGVVAARTEQPLAVIEIGASAGLLLRWEWYHYDFGPAGAVGDAGSPVRIDCGLRGTDSTTGAGGDSRSDLASRRRSRPCGPSAIHWRPGGSRHWYGPIRIGGVPGCWLRSRWRSRTRSTSSQATPS